MSFSPSAAGALLSLCRSQVQWTANAKESTRSLTVWYSRTWIIFPVLFVSRSFLLLFLSLCLLPSSQAAVSVGRYHTAVRHRASWKKKNYACAVELWCGAGYDVEGIKASLRLVAVHHNYPQSSVSQSNLSQMAITRCFTCGCGQCCAWRIRVLVFVAKFKWLIKLRPLITY